MLALVFRLCLGMRDARVEVNVEHVPVPDWATCLMVCPNEVGVVMEEAGTRQPL